MSNIIEFPKPVEGLSITSDGKTMKIVKGNNTIDLKDGEITWFANEVMQCVPLVEVSMILAGMVALLGASIHHDENNGDIDSIESDVDDYWNNFMNFLNYGL